MFRSGIPWLVRSGSLTISSLMNTHTQVVGEKTLGAYTQFDSSNVKGRKETAFN